MFLFYEVKHFINKQDQEINSNHRDCGATALFGITSVAIISSCQISAVLTDTNKAIRWLYNVSVLLTSQSRKTCRYVLIQVCEDWHGRRAAAREREVSGEGLWDRARCCLLPNLSPPLNAYIPVLVIHWTQVAEISIKHVKLREFPNVWPVVVYTICWHRS